MKMALEGSYDKIDDWDTLSVFHMFDEIPGGLVLEVGAHDEPFANILTEQGFNVIGVDLREYDGGLPTCNYRYVRDDFCDLPSDFWAKYRGQVDSVVAISCVEHFGLGTYQEGNPHAYYDVLAMRCIWDLLKPGGSCYLTVPFGGVYIEHWPHWRIYDWYHLNIRLVQDFTMELAEFLVAGPLTDWAGNSKAPGDLLLLEEASAYSGSTPHITASLKLRKGGARRRAPEGR